MEPEERGPRHQRRVDLEMGIFGGGTDQNEKALFHRRQQGVLLRLVETVNLVEKQNGAHAAFAETMAGLGDHLPHVFHRRGHCRQLLEDLLGLRSDESGESGLAGSGRTPENHRRQPIGLDQGSQRAPGGQQMSLPDHIVEALRAKARRQRRSTGQRGIGRCAEQVVSHAYLSGGLGKDPETEFFQLRGFELTGCVGERIGA